MKYLRTRITEVLKPAPNYVLLRFAGSEPIPARPGEFVMVRGEWDLVTAPLARLLENDSNTLVYSCGPDGMLHAVANVAQRAGVPCQVALEAPMACGMGTCKGCAVMGTDGVYKYVCYDGPVFEASDIFEAVS